ncbi:MAG: ArsR family transcriptional regulator [Anaerolineae bacterium]|jgi:SOS-response transcriptional repressor LexA|nr:ArsR family transcriptional regulator [Anaerolineae bacterium]
MPLPDQTMRIYQFISEQIQQEQLPPTHREIAKACFIAPAAVEHHLEILTKAGLILRIRHTARGIRLLSVDEA